MTLRRILEDKHVHGMLVVMLVSATSCVIGFARNAGLSAPPHKQSNSVVFTVPDVSGLRLFLRDSDGKTYGTLEAARLAATSSGHKVLFAMNAGMYEADRTPTGLYIQDGKQVIALNSQSRPQDAHTPNFYLNPNGVFAIASSGPVILSTEEFAKARPKDLSLATQSGPVLLAGRRLVARAVATGSDAQELRIRRNGVCVNGKTVVLVEVDAMTLHQFAIFLRDVLACQDALYMDGGVSSVYDARTGRSDRVSSQSPLGPIIAYLQ